MQFSELLSAGRKVAGLTQQELADRVGRQAQAILDWEAGRRVPPYEAALAVADAIGVERSRMVKAAGYDVIVETVERVTPMTIEDAIEADETLTEPSRMILRAALAAARASGASRNSAQDLQDALDDARLISEALEREDRDTS